MVVEVATELGCEALAPLLPGHGRSLDELASSRWDDWRQCAEECFQSLAARHGSVVVAGVSMGALLALDLAASHPQHVVGAVGLAPAFRLCWPFPSLALQVHCGLGLPDIRLPKKTGPDIHDAKQRRTQVTSSAQPAYSGDEVRKAGHRVWQRLPEVRCPTFLAHGARDHVCPLWAARVGWHRLGSADRELLVLPRSYHVVTRDVDRGLLRMRLYRFLRSLVARHGLQSRPPARGLAGARGPADAAGSAAAATRALATAIEALSP